MHFLLPLFVLSFAYFASGYAANLGSGSSRFLHHLNKPEVVRPAGNLTTILKPQWDVLHRLSMRRVMIAPGAFREPHWHTNANQLSYCLRGTGLVTIVFYTGGQQTFTISAGQAYYIPAGLLHMTENIDTTNNSTLEFVNVYTSDAMEEFQVSTALEALPDAVLGNSFQIDAKIFKDIIKHDSAPTYFAVLPAEQRLERQFHLLSMYKVDVNKIVSQSRNPEGSIKMLDQRIWPVLDRVSMHAITIGASSMVAPHWHPQTSELGYVASGKLRVSIISPDGTVETVDAREGDVYFVPAGYPHHMENTAEEETFVLQFFDVGVPGTIGYSSSFSVLPTGVLAASMGVNATQMPALPFYPAHEGWLVRMNNPEQ